jgi:hypothetical protein
MLDAFADETEQNSPHDSVLACTSTNTNRMERRDHRPSPPPHSIPLFGILPYSVAVVHMRLRRVLHRGGDQYLVDG